MISVIAPHRWPATGKTIRTLRTWPEGNPLRSGVPQTPVVGVDDCFQDIPGGDHFFLNYAHPSITDSSMADSIEFQMEVDGGGFATVGTRIAGTNPIDWTTGESNGSMIAARCRAILGPLKSEWSAATDAVLQAP